MKWTGLATIIISIIGGIISSVIGGIIIGGINTVDVFTEKIINLSCIDLSSISNKDRRLGMYGP